MASADAERAETVAHGEASRKPHANPDLNPNRTVEAKAVRIRAEADAEAAPPP